MGVGGWGDMTVPPFKSGGREAVTSSPLAVSGLVAAAPPPMLFPLLPQGFQVLRRRPTDSVYILADAARVPLSHRARPHRRPGPSPAQHVVEEVGHVRV